MLLSIFTPTFNRSKLLIRLYDSLLKQTNKNFEWIVVDDGSTDNTRQVIESLNNENLINIKYFYKPNGGKHTAYNLAVENCKGDLCFCVDSDDFLSEFAVENILTCWMNFKHSDNCAGIIAKKRDLHNKVFMSDLPSNKEITLFELDNVYKCVGDKCFVFNTSIAINYLFPEFANEKFFPESYIYDSIGSKYKFISLNNEICICEYQLDGYSNNFINVMINNPIGFKLFYRQRISMSKTFVELFKYSIRFNAFRILSMDNKVGFKGFKFLVIVFTIPLGWLLTKYYKLKKRLK